MGPESRRSQATSEDGAVAITVSIVLIILLALLAFVIDLGLVRVDVRHSQIAAESASQAGVHALSDGKTYEEACQAAADILESNLDITLRPDLCDDFAPGVFNQGSIDCESRAASGDDPTNDPTEDAPLYTEDTDGDHTIRIQMPVRDTDEQMSGQTIDTVHDGTSPCDRVAVSVRRARSLFFGSFVGAGGPVSGFADAVSRYSIEEGEELVPSLVVLDPTGCVTINARSGGSWILVGHDGGGQPGIITVDSNGSTCDPLGTTRNDYVMRTGGNSARICAGLTNLAAMLAADDLNVEDCDSVPETLFSPAVASGKAVRPADDDKVHPEALQGDDVTRRPIDHRYNCRGTGRGGYPLYPSEAGSEIWHLHYLQADGSRVEPCEDKFGDTNRLIDDRNHIDQIASHFRPATDPSSWVGGVSDWMVVSGGACSGTQTHDAQATGQHLFLNCDVSVNNGDVFTIDTAGYVVIAGTLDIKGEFRLNMNDDTDVTMMVNGGGVALGASSSSDMTFNRTLVFLNQGSFDVRSDAFDWSAPTGRTAANPDPSPRGGAYDDDPKSPTFRDAVNCELDTSTGAPVPSPECFEDLALWSNNEGQHQMTGGGNLSIEGTFFAPNAGVAGGPNDTWFMRGNSNQPLDGAQFFSYRFDLAGNSKIPLVPDPERNTTILEPVLRLIR